jgi:hypothetical protein
MIKFEKKIKDVFSIKKFKENPFSGLSNLKFHKNKNLILLKERKLEWASEYFIIYNSDNIDHN